jgi:membrane-bound lytic murein transglycosylase D
MNRSPLALALLLALASLAGGQSVAAVPTTPTAPTVPTLPVPIPVPVPAPPPPLIGPVLPPQPQVATAPVEPAPPVATDTDTAPTKPAELAPAKPTPAMTDGATVFARLRKNLDPDACNAGNNSARWRQRYAGSPVNFSRRLQSVLPLIDFVSVEVERSGLPAEFTFIPLVESWYQPGAIGPGGPAGMWQMIASTARNHGIHIRDGYDGRLSPVESTRAALSYLRVLQDMFGGDWQAMVMAYNAGEGRMLQAMRRAGSRVTSAADRRPHGLSNITYDYVDKLRALSCLVTQPQRANLRLPMETRFEPLVPLLMDPGVRSLDEFARIRGKDADELRRLNPGFRNGRIVDGVPRLVLSPPGLSVPTPVLVASAPPPVEPQETPPFDDEQEIAELLDAALAGESWSEPEFVDAPAPIVAEAAAPAAPVFVETVALVEASRAGASPVQLSDADVPDADASDAAPTEHEVRSGESLWSIARQHHLPIEQLRRANGLGAKAVVHPGQVLRLVP